VRESKLGNVSVRFYTLDQANGVLVRICLSAAEGARRVETVNHPMGIAESYRREVW
jgi:hypothetical protein